MTDCLIIGFNDVDFAEYVKMVRSQGEESGAFRGLNLAFVTHQGKPYRSMDLLNRLYSRRFDRGHRQFSNVDFLWPVISYLGSYLRQRGFTFDYVNLFHLQKDVLREKLLQGDVLTVAITTTLYVSVEPILEIIEFVRRYNHTARIVVGGPYIHNQVQMLDDEGLQSLFKYINADIYVIGPEGEAALVNTLAALKNGSQFSQVCNIAFRDGSRYVRTLTAFEDNPLAENRVDYQLFDKVAFGGFVTIRTAKSCPFSCSFCAFPQRAGKYSFLNVELVEQELNAIRDIGTITTVTFIDDTFNVPKLRFKEILRMMIRNRYGFRWNSFLRSDHVDDEALDLMAASGCEGVFLGVESGSNLIVQQMNKSSRRDDYLRVIPQLQKRGISTHANLIVGFPSETHETVEESVSLIEEAQPDFFRAQLWYADPTTPVWRRREEFGIHGSSFNWKHDTMDAATAMDLIENIFLRVDHSIWLPEWGFEQWSVFYLQRRGMSLNQVKEFVKGFNAAIKEKLVFPQRIEISPELLTHLERICRVEGSPSPDVAPPQVLTAANYKADYEYWSAAFSGATGSGSLVDLRDVTSGADRGWDCVARTWSTQCDDFEVSWDTDVEGYLLAAFAIVLARWTGRTEVALITRSRDETGAAVPLKLATPWTSSFQDIVHEVCIRRELASKHRNYALHLLTKGMEFKNGGRSGPVLSSGCYLRGSAAAATSLFDGLNDYPSIARNLDLVLETSQAEKNLRLQWLYDRSAFRAETIQQLSIWMTGIMEAASRSPDTPIGEIDRTSIREGVKIPDINDEFHF